MPRKVASATITVTISSALKPARLRCRANFTTPHCRMARRLGKSACYDPPAAMLIRRLPLFALGLLGLVQVQAQSPSPAPSPVASATPRAEEIPEAYRRVLASLRNRAEDPLPKKEI